MTDTKEPTPRGDVLREALKATGWTRLQADYERGGWRLHDFPDKPNPQGMWYADYICGGLEQDQAEAIALAVNAALLQALTPQAQGGKAP